VTRPRSYIVISSDRRQQASAATFDPLPAITDHLAPDHLTEAKKANQTGTPTAPEQTICTRPGTSPTRLSAAPSPL
jgi:hypothetical protein